MKKIVDGIEVALTDEEIADEAQRAADWEATSPARAKAAIQTQIDVLERTQLLPRITREGLLAAAVDLAATQNVTEPQLYAANIAYSKLKDFDAQITTLRTQMDAIT